MAEGIAVNKKALHDYDILEKLEAGIVLTGAETKSAKSGGLNLRGAHMIIRDGEAYIVGAQISAYKSGHQGDDYDPSATRKLLLKRAEINRLIGKKEEERLTIVPLGAYITKSGRIKLTIAVARGRKEYEKRGVIKKRDIEREMRSALKTKKR
jgi:SsrA-binding protein